MRKRAFNKITAVTMAFLLILLSIIPSTVITNAAPLNLVLTVEYNADTGHYELSYPVATLPAKTTISWHDQSGAVVSTTDAGNFDAGKAIFTFDFLPDHIYDISVQAFTNIIDVVPYATGSTYYLADITFTGESFNVMAKMSDIEDKTPELSGGGIGSAITAESGNHPFMQLRWKIPTIYNATTGKVESITSQTHNEFLTSLSDPAAAIDTVGFQISMNKGKSSTVTLNFNTAYSGANMILEGGDYQDSNHNTVHHNIDGITNGDVDPAGDGFVTLTLDETNGIEPGTEYEYTNIGIIFENNLLEQIPIRRTNLRTDSDNHFMVNNIDNAFSDYGTNLTSIFTPLQFEISKIDVDKVQVIFRRITNGVYPELFYQVQYAPRIDDLYTQASSWVKIPDSTLPTGQLYGSEIVDITVPGTTNPEYYFRVVYFDSSSEDPKSSSLCLNLQLLGIDSGKPALPREIQVEAVYAGRGYVRPPHAPADGSEDIEIPESDLRISFEKPLSWKLLNWNTFKTAVYADEDYTFHILLSTYLPGTVVAPETKDIGLNQVETVYMPVKQKRVLVIGKKDLVEDPNDPDRLICTIPGNKLFWDYTADPTDPDNPGVDAIANENNEDPSEDGIPGDYPSFLVPNTTYYMQIFSSRYEDNVNIYTDLWGDAAGLAIALKDRLSYVSPIVSFTTWPLNELPVPMPNIQLGIEPATNVDPVTGDITLDGIAVNYERVLTDTEWQRYTSVQDGREIVYEAFLSQDASNESSFTKVAEDRAPYPAKAEVIGRNMLVEEDGSGAPIKPNTVYYLKARASLYVGGVLIGRSVFTPVKAITTPKIDSGNLDNLDRDPRAPSEFNIAVDGNGDQLLSDAWVDFSWVHAENDVTYEMVCTSGSIDPDAKPDDAQDGIAGDTDNAAFLDAYSDFMLDPSDNTITIDPGNPDLTALGFTRNENGKIMLPITRNLLRPNRTYFFSMRAVRNQGQVVNGESIETTSRWVTVPVTTKMVKAPSYLEAVRDLEIGFNVTCGQPGSTADSMEIYMKKGTEPDSSYVKLLRSQYSAVKDGTTYYFRIYNLEANLWYDFKLYNKVGSTWYKNATETWNTSVGTPVEAKTRDTLHEIEVRWEGEGPYTYFLEALGESDTDYEKLSYHASGLTDYGYDLPNGSRIMFYREKTSLFVEEGSSKFIYYAKITGKPIRNANGSVTDTALKTNTLYSVKLWAYNLEESLHVGPVSVRTDFSQEDYDDQKKTDDVIDVYNLEAEGLMQKLYWSIDKSSATTVRALIKSDMVSGLLQASPGMTVTIDLSGELQDPSVYDILVPQKVLETIEGNDSRLNIKLNGAEITLSKGSIDLAELKRQSLANGAKEAMMRMHIDRSGNVKKTLPSGFKSISKDYNLSVSAIGSRRSYAEINAMIYSILKDSKATGPFKYGLFDRELTKGLVQIENYSYRSHSELNDMIADIMSAIETEMSRYLKDIIDGGSGLPADFAVNKPIVSFPGRIGFKIEYQNEAGLIAPYVNYNAAPGWKEPAGAKGYVMQYVLFRVESPGEYVVVVSSTVSISPGGSYGDMIWKLGGKYDLSKVFGKTTLYPANPITGQQAVMLYAVIAERDNEMTGLTPSQKISKLGIGDIISAKELTGYMDNQRSTSLAVKLYCEKAGIPLSMLKPTKTITISNASQINSRLYQYVVLGIDLGFTKTKNNQFDATGRSATGQMLDMISKVLEKLGEI